MKIFSKTLNLIPVFLIGVLIIGILCSYFNLGFLSVFLSVFLPFFFILNTIFLILGIFKKKYYYGIGVVVFLIFFNFFFRIPAKDVSGQSINDVSILAYNVQGFNAYHEIDEEKDSSKILEFINEQNPDILALQESSFEGRSIKNYPYNFLGYLKNKEVLALYSKHPILKTGYVNFPYTANNGIYADIIIHQDTIRVYNIHLQSFGVTLNSFKENILKNLGFLANINNTVSKQVQQAKLVKSHATECNKKVIICGDFNSTQFSLPYKILKKGLNDSFISKGQGLGTTYSLFHYPLRLDFFLLDERLEVINHENFDLNLSDHEPILMTFKIKD